MTPRITGLHAAAMATIVLFMVVLATWDREAAQAIELLVSWSCGVVLGAWDIQRQLRNRYGRTFDP